MSNLIPRDESLSRKSDKELLGLLTSSPAIMRTKVLHEIALRRTDSNELKKELFTALSEEKNRKEVFFGFIKVAWIPIIEILETGSNTEISELKEFLKREWNLTERKQLYEYLKKDFDLTSILD